MAVFLLDVGFLSRINRCWFGCCFFFFLMLYKAATNQPKPQWDHGIIWGYFGPEPLQVANFTIEIWPPAATERVCLFFFLWAVLLLNFSFIRLLYADTSSLLPVYILSTIRQCFYQAMDGFGDLVIFRDLVKKPQNPSGFLSGSLLSQGSVENSQASKDNGPHSTPISSQLNLTS